MERDGKTGQGKVQQVVQQEIKNGMLGTEKEHGLFPPPSSPDIKASDLIFR